MTDAEAIQRSEADLERVRNWEKALGGASDRRVVTDQIDERLEHIASERAAPNIDEEADATLEVEYDTLKRWSNSLKATTGGWEVVKQRMKERIEHLERSIEDAEEDAEEDVDDEDS